MAKRQPFTKEFKLEAVRRWKSSGHHAVAVARELGLRRNHLYTWQLELETHGKTSFPGKGGRAHTPQQTGSVHTLLGGLRPPYQQDAHGLIA